MAVGSFRDELIKAVEALGVEYRLAPGRQDGFAGLSYGGKSFAHFHGDGGLDIRLTRAVIKREGLTHPPDSTNHPRRSPNSQWIEIPLASPNSIDRVVHLVRIAIAQL